MKNQRQSNQRRNKKSALPTKICPRCLRPFRWRKKWQACWQEVIYCSERCRRTKCRD